MYIIAVKHWCQKLPILKKLACNLSSARYEFVNLFCKENIVITMGWKGLAIWWKIHWRNSMQLTKCSHSFLFSFLQREIIGSTGMILSEVERNLTLLFTSYKRSKRYQSFSQVELFQSIIGLKAGNWLPMVCIVLEL